MNKEQLLEKYIAELRGIVQFAPEYACEGYAVGLLKKFGSELYQLFQQTHVMRWQDFISQQPDNNQLVLIKNLETGQVTEEVWKVDFDYPPFSRINCVWLPSPAVA